MDFGFAAVFLLVTSSGNLFGVNGYSDGAPSSVCSTMLPVHRDFTAQNSRPPYQITTSSTTYSPGHSILGKCMITDFILCCIICICC